MSQHCVHSCKGLCNALTAAERREEETIQEYRGFADACEYPDVKTLLDKIVASRMQSLQGVRELRALLTARFATLDQANDAFA